MCSAESLSASICPNSMDCFTFQKNENKHLKKPTQPGTILRNINTDNVVLSSLKPNRREWVLHIWKLLDQTTRKHFGNTGQRKKPFTIFPDNTIVLSSYFDTSTFEISHVRHSVTHDALPDTTLPTKVVLWGLGRLEPSNSKNLLAVPL